MTTSKDALLIGGPRNDTLVTAGETALVELEIDGLIHRWIRTTEQRDRDGSAVTVYNYDGAVAPEGGEPGAESSKERVASPLAAGMTGTQPQEASGSSS